MDIQSVELARIMIVTGFAGLLVSRYLAAFQLGYIDAIWDPFFGQGTRQVLNSTTCLGRSLQSAHGSSTDRPP